MLQCLNQECVWNDGEMKCTRLKQYLDKGGKCESAWYESKSSLRKEYTIQDLNRAASELSTIIEGDE